MKKKYLWSILAFVMVTMMCAVFISCGGDDSEGTSSNNPLPAVTSAKVGDIYYSDGTCSSTIAKEKIPIGIIVYVGSDPVSENMNGLVMALHNSGSKEMYYPNYGYNTITATNLQEAIHDMNGLGKTKNLAKRKSYAAVSAVDYEAPIPSETSGWFIPSIGQWIAVLNNFGAGITSETTIGVFTGDSKILENINSTLSKVGEEGVNYTPISSRTGSGQAGYYWSSSFSDRNKLWEVVFNYESGIRLGKGANEMSPLRVRPFLAY